MSDDLKERLRNPLHGTELRTEALARIEQLEAENIAMSDGMVALCTLHEAKVEQLEAQRTQTARDYDAELAQHTTACFDVVKQLVAQLAAAREALGTIRECLGYTANEGKSLATKESNANVAWHAANGALTATQGEKS